MGANFEAKPVSLISILCSIIFLFIFFTIPISVSAENNTPSAYDVVQQYDFPVGILPQGVVSYEFDNSNGEFKVNLSGTCAFKILSFDLKYESTISGVITKDSISSLGGIQVKVVSTWLNITGVTRNQDKLKFSAGIVSAKFAVSNFNMSPTCN